MAAPTPAKRSPDGYVAQRVPHDLGGHGHWLLTSLDENGIVTIQTFSDEDVADWAPLHDQDPDEGSAAAPGNECGNHAAWPSIPSHGCIRISGHGGYHRSPCGVEWNWDTP